MWTQATLQLIEAAYAEDVGGGDLTSTLLPNGEQAGAVRVVARQDGVICGLSLAPAICTVFGRELGAELTFTPEVLDGRPVADGDVVTAGTCVATLSGAIAAILTTERTLLNFMGRMSGVATLTRRYVDAAHAAAPDVKVLDTRKTIPGWRELDKYAVQAGGGRNHREGLFDAVLIKDNHLAGIPTDRLVEGLASLLEELPPTAEPRFIEVEVDDLDQFAEVCRVPAVDIVLLDNFTTDQLAAAVKQRDAEGLRGKLRLEASGGVMLESIGAIAATGVDRISVGALTHSATCFDLAIDA